MARVFFAAAGDSFRVTTVLYLRACVGEQLFETKTAEFSSPASLVSPSRAKNSRQRCAESNFEGKSGFGCRGRRRRDAESSPFAHIFLASRLVNILSPLLSSLLCAALRPPPLLWPLFSFAFLPVFVLPFCAPTGAAAARKRRRFACILIAHVTVLFQGKRSRENAV